MGWCKMDKFTPIEIEGSLALIAYAMLRLIAEKDAPLHGSLLFRKLKRRFAGRMKVANTTMYRTLINQADAGWLMQVDASDPDDDPRRKYYQITPEGRLALRSIEALLELIKAPEVVSIERE